MTNEDALFSILNNTDALTGNLFTDKGTIELARVSTVEALVVAIERDIFNGLWSPGEQITEQELVNRYGVSRNSIREALVLIISQRYLEKRTNKSVMIRNFGKTDIEDIYYTRQIFEEVAVRELAKKHLVPKELLRALENIRCHTESTPWSNIILSDMVYHKTLVDSLNSPRLSDLFSGVLVDFMLINRRPKDVHNRQIDKYKLHSQIEEAIERGDINEAVKCLHLHLSDACAIQVKEWENTV